MLKVYNKLPPILANLCQQKPIIERKSLPSLLEWSSLISRTKECIFQNKKWKVVLFNDPRVATCQIWTTTNLNNNISCGGYAWKTRPIWQLVHDWPVWWTMGWNSGLATSRLRLRWKRSGSSEKSHQESKIKKVDHPRLQIHDGHTQTVGNPATQP